MKIDEWDILILNPAFIPTTKDFKNLIHDWQDERTYLKKQVELFTHLNKIYSKFLRTVEEENRLIKSNYQIV